MRQLKFVGSRLMGFFQIKLLLQDESETKLLREDLAEKLYTEICKHKDPSIASQITGMLMELDHHNLKILIADESKLQEKVNLAIETMSMSTDQNEL